VFHALREKGGHQRKMSGHFQEFFQKLSPGHLLGRVDTAKMFHRLFQKLGASFSDLLNAVKQNNFTIMEDVDSSDISDFMSSIEWSEAFTESMKSQ
jgi:hypothetical protein